MDQIYIGNFAKGMKTNPLPFNIDNDAFPVMYNFFSWRGRAKRKRGTVLLGQLRRQLQSVVSPNSWQVGVIMTLNGSGAGSANLVSLYTLGTGSSIAPGTITFSDGTNTYTDSGLNGTLTGTAGGSGTINYATGAITITGGAAGQNVIGTFSYFPGLPVMGLEDFVTTSSAPFAIPLDFDTKYAYQFNESTQKFYSVSYYKTTNNPVVWTGQDYQQFWSTNYQGAFWATNNVAGNPFVAAAYVAGSTTAAITFHFTISGVDVTNLTLNDQIYFNEWSGGSTINTLVGSITNIAGAAAGQYIVTFSGAQTVAGTGVAQILTQTVSGDGIRWYDGDPTGGTGLPTTTSFGWVNFAPPLSAASYSISDLPAAVYYLVGALIILPFKDRLLCFSPWVKTATGTAVQLPDTVIWSQNGTPYYNSVIPVNQTYDAAAWYEDQTGRGGYLQAGLNQNIITVNSNEDVLIVGFTGYQTRFVYTGNDFSPFLFFLINSELNSMSTFSSVSLDRGVLSVGQYGITMTMQQSTQRIDLDIPDEIFNIQADNNGFLRVNSTRDFYREWVYFTYPIDFTLTNFPTRSFLYNYRDGNWAILYENYTAQGLYRRQTGVTWASSRPRTWAEWRETWDSGSNAAEFPSTVGGNPQGYVLIKGQGTGEATSGTIKALASSGGITQITSVNHCVEQGDFLYISGAIGVTNLNGLIGKVETVIDVNNFTIDIGPPSGTYLGLGKFTRLSLPLLQTKQFNFYWQQGKQVRLGVQKYLMDKTADAQVTVNIYLSQNPDDVWNGNILDPSPNSLIYSQTMYTCPEDPTSIGVTAANTNLQQLTAYANQRQIWHRLSTSLMGDSVQVGITLSDTQMRNLTYATSEITLHGMNLTVYPGPILC